MKIGADLSVRTWPGIYPHDVFIKINRQLRRFRLRRRRSRRPAPNAPLAHNIRGIPLCSASASPTLERGYNKRRAVSRSPPACIGYRRRRVAYQASLYAFATFWVVTFLPDFLSRVSEVTTLSSATSSPRSHIALQTRAIHWQGNAFPVSAQMTPF